MVGMRAEDVEGKEELWQLKESIHGSKHLAGSHLAN